MSFSVWWDRDSQNSVWKLQPEKTVEETDLVGKEQVTNRRIFWVLQDGSDDLQHGSDSCMEVLSINKCLCIYIFVI